MPAIGTYRETQEEWQSFIAGGKIDEIGPWDDICYAMGLFTHVNAIKGLVRHLQGITKYNLD